MTAGLTVVACIIIPDQQYNITVNRFLDYETDF